MGYKMKRGAKPKFKELASSPVKQKPGGIVGEAVDHWQKYKAKKKAFKEFDKWHKTLEKSDRYYRENPQYKKPVKDLISKKPTSTTSGTAKAMQNVPKQFTNLSKTKMLKQVVKAGRIGLKGSIVGGLITEGLLAAHKSGQKHSGGKAVKGQKTGVVAPKKSIFKKKDRY